MGKTSSSAERNRNIWAPWRMEYIDSLGRDDNVCFLCRHRDDPARDEANLVLWRGKHTFSLLNRFPYTGGHSIVAPYAHVAEMADLDDAAMLEMFQMLRDLQKALAAAVRAQGFNVGINIGGCAGAGLPGHIHAHIVPRWAGDTNFMPVLCGAKVIPIRLETLRGQILQAGAELNLPKLA
jgi:ATP adenylyltransferase